MKTFNSICVPPQVGWRITSTCNYAQCCFCYAPRNNEFIENITTQKIADGIIEKAEKYLLSSGNRLRVVISGGEPLVDENVVEIIKKFSRSNNIKTTLSTNGYLLLDKFPDYHEYLDIIALPIEGGKEKNNHIRGDGHYELILNILNHASLKKVKIKIETVILPDTTEDDLFSVKKLCEKYDVRSWKLFDYNHYDERNSYCANDSKKYQERNSIIDRWLILNNERWIVHETVENRNRRHFIINPNGDIIIPCRDNSTHVFVDRKLANVLVDFDNGIKMWWESCNFIEVQNHFMLMNEVDNGLYADNISAHELTYFDKKMLIEGAYKAGVERIYFKDYRYRRFSERDESIESLDDFLSIAKSKIVIISHGMSSGSDQLINFLENVFIDNPDKNPEFSFTLVLPQPYCYADYALRESNDKNYTENIAYLERKINEVCNKIKSKNANPKEPNIFIKYTEEIIFGSTILIDDYHIQTETKYAGVPEDYNLILGVSKTNRASYFDAQLKGIHKILDNSGIKKKNKQLEDAIKTILSLFLAILTIVFAGVAFFTKLPNWIAPLVFAIVPLLTIALSNYGKIHSSFVTVLEPLIKKPSKTKTK
jgi:MoaA/NifB/PqqE/SkfB family radical SAM enzyme